MSVIFILPSVPWFFKPCLAFVSDTCPIFGMRRKPYLIIFSLVQTVGYLMLAFAGTSAVRVEMALLTIALGAAVCSALSEALVVEVSTIAGLSGGQRASDSATTSVSELIGAKVNIHTEGTQRVHGNRSHVQAVGSLVTAYLSGALLEVSSMCM